jgi:hypothetical protein
MKVLLDGHTDFENKFKIKFLEPQICLHTNGFISVQLDWVKGKKCGDDYYKFKYANLTHRSYGGTFYIKKKKYFNIISASFEFEETIKQCENLDITPWFDVSIATENEDASFEESFDYLFFENTKYGLICWFSPSGWQDWSNTKKIQYGKTMA